MTAAPFRDLFVELPRALFDVLQGIGDVAVREAARPVVTFSQRSKTSLVLDAFDNRNAMTAVGRRFGWRTWSMQRSAMDATLEVRAILDCGHKLRGEIDEQLIESALSLPAVIIDEVDRINDTHRTCSCVRRPE